MAFVLFTLFGFTTREKDMSQIVDKGLQTAMLHSQQMAMSLLEQKDQLPRTIGKNGTFVTSNSRSWSTVVFV